MSIDLLTDEQRIERAGEEIKKVCEKYGVTLNSRTASFVQLTLNGATPEKEPAIITP
jgi:hypothetical protein